MIIDIAFVFFLLFGFFRGFRQGLILSVFSTLAWLLGIIGSLKFTAMAVENLQQTLTRHSAYMPFIVFVIIFTAIVLLVNLLGKLLEKIVEIAMLGMLNKLAGGILRAAIFIILFSTMLWLINQAGMISPAMKMQSKLYDAVNPIAPYGIHLLSKFLPSLTDLFSDIKNYFDHIPSKYR